MTSRNIKDVLVLIAGPGAGKGTILRSLQKEYGHVPISTGDAITEFSNPDNRLYGIIQSASGPLHIAHKAAERTIESYNQGELASTKDIRILIEAKRQLEGSPRKIALDGFPRQVEQSKVLDDILQTPFDVRYMDVSDENLEFRQGLRRDKKIRELVSEKTFGIYQKITSEDEKIAYIESVLQQSLLQVGVRRTDLTREARLKRIAVFRNETVPAAKYFSKEPFYKEFNGNVTPKEAYLHFKATFTMLSQMKESLYKKPA